MNASEVRDLSDDELQDKLIELKREQFNLRFQGASGQLEKTGRVRQVRRDIARIKTIQTQRRQPAEAAPEPKSELASAAAQTETQASEPQPSEPQAEVTADA